MHLSDESFWVKDSIFVNPTDLSDLKVKLNQIFWSNSYKKYKIFG